ncbi:hypothetical protein L9Z17_20510 [Leptospira noguchii]|nr:hypothetical protein [Leptospira noguchii]
MSYFVDELEGQLVEGQVHQEKTMAFDIEMIRSDTIRSGPCYKARKVVGRPLTLTEKILYSHLWMANPKPL